MSRRGTLSLNGMYCGLLPDGGSIESTMLSCTTRVEIISARCSRICTEEMHARRPSSHPPRTRPQARPRVAE